MRTIKALMYRNIKIFMRNRLQLILLLIMPYFYLYLISTIFKSVSINDSMNYVLAGIVIIVVFQTSLNIATSTIEDISSGYMKEVLVSPVKRVEIAIGQILSSTMIATCQGVLILIIGYFLGMKYTEPMTPFAIIASMILIGIVFSSFGLFLAASVKNAQTFQIISVAVTTPITFLCGVYVPLSLLPNGLQFLSLFNPMTYATAFFRALSLEKLSVSTDELVAQELAFNISNFVITPQISVIIVALFGLIFIILSTIVFSKVDFSRVNRPSGNKDIFQQ